MFFRNKLPINKIGLSQECSRLLQIYVWAIFSRIVTVMNISIKHERELDTCTMTPPLNLTVEHALFKEMQIDFNLSAGF